MEITRPLHAPLSKLSGYRTIQSPLFLRRKYTFQYIARRIVSCVFAKIIFILLLVAKEAKPFLL